jgi:rubredoxin
MTRSSIKPARQLLVIMTTAYCCGIVEIGAFQPASMLLMKPKANFRALQSSFSNSNSEFDFILQEGEPITEFDQQQQELYHDPKVTRKPPPIVVLPDTSKVFLASASTIRGSRSQRERQKWFYEKDPDAMDDDEDDGDEDYDGADILRNNIDEEKLESALDEYYEKEEEEETSASSTPITSATENPSLAVEEPSKRIKLPFNVPPRETKRSSLTRSKGLSYPSVSTLLEKQDYLGVLWKWGVPVTAGAIGVAASAKFLTSAYQTEGLKMCESYANEMVYHDGDFEEMKLCHRDWKRKMRLYFPIPNIRKTKMLSSYLETFTKKKPVSPQAVSSLSFVLTMYKLTEQQAARILTQVAKKQLGQDKKPASAGKLLFYGTHILKSKEAQADLSPIRQMLASSYKVGGDMFVANSQKTMGEAAYKTAVAAAGKAAGDKLTPGWEVLGLDKETAQKLFEEVKKDGFVTGAQKLYGEKFFEQKDKEKKTEDGKKDESDDDATPSGMVYECSECGYTMFPAKGREFKFLPDDFKCPECGASKDKFVDLSKMD